MDPAASSPSLRPGLLRRAAAGAWEVPAGFWFLARNPRLWPLAGLPTILAVVLAGTGAFAGLVLVPRIDASLGPSPGSLPEWLALPMSVLLGVATIGAFAFLGLGLAFALAAPLLDELSRRVEARARGSVEDASRGLRSEIVDSLRGALYFLAAAPGMFLLGFIPIVGPLLSLLWGGRAVAMQMTDPALTRRGLRFADKRGWHREWRAETLGFGVAGMLGLIVPLANLLIAPALVTGGTLLVLDLEDAAAETSRALRRLRRESPGTRASGTAAVTG
ncbi:MAG: EI24 domain-containing protein [Burkholderiales bacterium]